MSRDRPRWWTELLLILVVYGAYAFVRVVARGDADTAVGNGLAILRVERLLSLNVEEPLNDLFTTETWLGVPSCFAYATLHYGATPAILVWLFRRRPLHYRLMRTWLLTSTLIGLVGFMLVPTSPPRLLDGGHGFVDTMAYYASYGWWANDASAPSGMGDFTNQYAAMPSLHVGWSLWCGAALWHYGRRTPVMRALAVGYPLIITIVVMGTANHYFLDALAGAAVMVAGLLLARPLLRLSYRIQTRLGLARPVPGTEHDSLPATPATPATPAGAGAAALPRQRNGHGADAGGAEGAVARRAGAARHNGAAQPRQAHPAPVAEP